jgi:multidrug efflux pump subunit AcrA (membrane-fusion protein)
MRKIIISVVGITILALGYLGFKGLSSSKKNPEKSIDKSLNSVYVTKVKNTQIPISIQATGSVLAKDRMVIYSEVQGVFEYSSKPFKTGTSFKKGEQLIRINSEEFKASIVAQRSSFKNIITTILVDISFDYPTSLEKWEKYLASIDINKNLPELPKVDSDQERNYITSKSIYSNFYSIKNLEVRLKKYSITSPYNGTLAEALVTPGTLITPGQKLGTFIRKEVFELELNVNASLQDFLKLGKSVELTNINKTKSFEGIVKRVSPQIDRSSQTIKIFVEIKSSDLKEGEYLEADIFAKQIEKGIEIPRSLLIKNKSIYVVEDGKLILTPVHVVYEKMNTVVIEGIREGVEYVSKSVPGAFEGMPVNILEN